MNHYLTPHEKLLQPVDELKNTVNTRRDKYVFRYVPLSSILDADKHPDKLFMSRIEDWNDPYEKKALTSKFIPSQGDAFYHPLAGSVYGTCFTEIYNCEAQWYYYGRKEPYVLLSIKLSVLLDALDKLEDQHFYIGRMSYCAQNDVQKNIALFVNQHIDVFRKGKNAEFTTEEMVDLLTPLLIKRIPFMYEREIRILKVEPNSTEKHINVSVGNFLDLVDQITISPFIPNACDVAQNDILDGIREEYLDDLQNKMQKSIQDMVKQHFGQSKRISRSWLLKKRKPSEIRLQNYL